MISTKTPSRRRAALDRRWNGQPDAQAAAPGARIREARRLAAIEAKRDRLDSEARKIRKALGC